MPPLVLELFCGTKSWGKVFSRKGMRVISVDIESRFNPTILADILELDYTALPVPDLITASPPCNSFSRLAVSNGTRDWWSLAPLKPGAKLGEKLAYKTLEIIQYFLKKNPSLLFVIENPHSMLYRMPIYNKLPRAETLYCFYKFPYRKATDFFNNFPHGLPLRSVATQPPCDKKKLGMYNVVHAPRDISYRIPPGIAREVYQAFVDQYKKYPPLAISFRKTKPTLFFRPDKKIPIHH